MKQMLSVLAVFVATAALKIPASGLQAPTFHHLHLNVTNPAASIEAYEKIFPGSIKTVNVAGFQGFAYGDLRILFTSVATPAPTQPQSAFWHEVWAVPDVRQFVTRMRAQNVKVLPLFTGDGRTVDINTDTFPGMLTKAGIADAKQKQVEPTRKGGYAYIEGPDGMMMEVVNRPVDTPERIVDLWQDDAICAVLWYERHFHATHLPVPETLQRLYSSAGAPPAPVSETTCKVARGEPSWPSQYEQGTIRYPSGRVKFGNVMLNWYGSQQKTPLASTLGQLADHIALRVTDLDAWMAKLRAENVVILTKPYKFGAARAVMVEGPSREALELIEEL